MNNPDIEQMLKAITPDIYERFKQAIEIRKWPNGERLTDEQLQTCMQAVIVYESNHLAKEQRTGFVPPKETPCADKPSSGLPSEDSTDTLKWR